MSDFDVYCMWIGRIMIGCSVIITSVMLFIMLLMKIMEKIFGKERLDRQTRVFEELTEALVWHQKNIQGSDKVEK